MNYAHLTSTAKKVLQKSPRLMLGIAVIFSLGLYARPTEAKQKIFPPAAVQLAEGLKNDMQRYRDAEVKFAEAQEIMHRSEASAHGKDIQLCADFQLSFSRVLKRLESNENCPL